jgi:hypothetical protein
MKKQLIALNPDKTIVFGSKGTKLVTPTDLCKLAGCDNVLSKYHGPGETKFCAEHQKTLREYKGFARSDRSYTLWKKAVCEVCGHNPFENDRIKLMAEPKKSVYAMRLLQVDHIYPSKNSKDKFVLGNEVNHPDNLQTLCGDCHQIKTLDNGDF